MRRMVVVSATYARLARLPGGGIGRLVR
ncbi:hypothetical protein FRAHR75_170028 [Frankia sp. Hr75.2]|nr:hypothetical protein FRAHR75_170028 [Frankia sp. Hr75.2]SQD94885.1 hypothetical protein FMEAI12_2840015 [Parafrankia sp. Ea1.12]